MKIKSINIAEMLDLLEYYLEEGYTHVDVTPINTRENPNTIKLDPTDPLSNNQKIKTIDDIPIAL